MKVRALLFAAGIFLATSALSAGSVRWSWDVHNLPSVVVQNPTECRIVVSIDSIGVVRVPSSDDVLGGKRVAVSPKRERKLAKKSARRAAKGKLVFPQPNRYINPRVLVGAGSTAFFQVEQPASVSRIEIAIQATAADTYSCRGHTNRTVSFSHHPIYSDPYRRNQQRTIRVTGVRPIRVRAERAERGD